MAGGEKETTLEGTAAFAAAAVCFVLVFFSIIVEHIIHFIGHWVKSRNRIKLYEPWQKIKSEFMLLGFMSFLLTISPDTVGKICIKAEVAHAWRPCKEVAQGVSKCKEGEVQFMSLKALHQLHIFIFVLACVHVLNCVLTMALGKAKMNHWQDWEKDTKTAEYIFSHDSQRFRYTKETSFGRRHMTGIWATNPFLLRVLCFFRQFYSSVPKVDYLTLRHGFIMAHLTPQNQANFNFHKYIDRSLEEDFKVVVGISPTIWLVAVLSLLLNKYDFYRPRWMPVVPFVVLLVVGTKLQVIIAKMALRIDKSSEVVVGTPVVELGDDNFWFNSPRFLLFLINLVIFQNAFQMAFYVYTWMTFGFKSCFHGEIIDEVIMICMGLLVLVLCSYVTLPLYALVTQMGSSMKPVIFSDEVANSLKEWHHKAKKHRKKHKDTSEDQTLSGHDSDDDTVHLEAADQVPHLIPSPNHTQSLRDVGNDGIREIESLQVAIERPSLATYLSKDFSLVKRTPRS